MSGSVVKTAQRATSEDVNFIPGLGTEIAHACRWGQKIFVFNFKKYKLTSYSENQMDEIYVIKREHLCNFLLA